MRSNKAIYFSLFFLFCFLASFSANAIQSLNLSAFKSDLVKKDAVSFSKKNRGTDPEIDLLSEENETEDAFGLSVFTLHFFTYNQRFPTVIQKPVSARSLTETPANPIYIAVCSFLI